MSARKIPETSKEAYRSLDVATLNERYKTILDALGKLGEATTEEIAAYAKVRHETIWKRFSELANMNLIYRPGNKRLMKSGRNGYTWMLCCDSTPKTVNSEKALKGDSIADISRNMAKIGDKHQTQPTLF